MPLSSEADSRLPSYSAGRKRDNEGADSPRKKKRKKKLHTQKGREESTQGTGSASAQRKTFLLTASLILLRLFSQTDPQMLVQTCSNSPTDHVGCICTSVTQAKKAPPPLSPSSRKQVGAGTQTRRRRRLEGLTCRACWQDEEHEQFYVIAKKKEKQVHVVQQSYAIIAVDIFKTNAFPLKEMCSLKKINGY